MADGAFCHGENAVGRWQRDDYTQGMELGERPKRKEKRWSQHDCVALFERAAVDVTGLPPLSDRKKLLDAYRLIGTNITLPSLSLISLEWVSFQPPLIEINIEQVKDV
jgi:hypothetical protein